MISILAQLFSPSAQAAEKTKLHSRQIYLSGNIFHFVLPEYFSKDMPAANMVETLDISDLNKFDNPEYGNLIRRWWDIKEPGWFGKNPGTVMMDISVQKVFENKQKLIHNHSYNIEDRFDFILMLNDSYHQRYDRLNAETSPESGNYRAYHSSFASMIGNDIKSFYRDNIYNQQKWINYSIAAPRDELIVVFAIPLTRYVFLEISFTYSQNADVSPLEFRRGYAYQKTEAIQQSFRVKYTHSNPFTKIVGEEWLEQTNDQVLEQYREAIVKLFCGSNPEAASRGMECQDPKYIEKN